MCNMEVREDLHGYRDYTELHNERLDLRGTKAGAKLAISSNGCCGKCLNQVGFGYALDLVVFWVCGSNHVVGLQFQGHEACKVSSTGYPRHNMKISRLRAQLVAGCGQQRHKAQPAALHAQSLRQRSSSSWGHWLGSIDSCTLPRYNPDTE